MSIIFTKSLQKSFWRKQVKNETLARPLLKPLQKINFLKKHNKNWWSLFHLKPFTIIIFILITLIIFISVIIFAIKLFIFIIIMIIFFNFIIIIILILMVIFFNFIVSIIMIFFNLIVFIFINRFNNLNFSHRNFCYFYFGF